METILKYNDHQINWNELKEIGIEKEFLHNTDQYNTLMAGEKTEPLPFKLNFFGIDFILDAHLQLEDKNGDIEIVIETAKPSSNITM